ncbi:efflux RND transporter periplasmic adaptor subunit [Psychrobium sp. 1_MG-2023]|uniref:efflux RND transporter periplasmic adaptor subunit n=1 Tax=Psychrobium sp. 1_MG-2023 TaxID=3062624 RepID=UPI000C345FD2|nr:efflux RND transporter periplasmic adaptor subunit [Psychrobium sp. 1_MG-2023]MDP2561369.1 efflux RND transporter periplasmic adaptor subunit [Psychrobium sp. 1_MG-2023]PKF54850.1 efflux RND transporter periplasmic adaptor subunit [Alteromonadales bacterium alter-6D02]
MRSIVSSFIILMCLSVHSTVVAATTQVKVIYPEQQPMAKALELSGTISAAQDAHLATLEQGVVKTLLVEAGDQVRQGQLLLTLDNKLARIRLAQSQASLQSAKVQTQESQRLYAETVELAKKEVIANTALAERKASLANQQALLAEAEAELALQQEILSRHQLKAPFAGIIAQRNVDVGEWVSPQANILQLVSNESLRLIVDVPQEYVALMQREAELKVEVRSDINPNKIFSLVLSQVVAVSNDISRTVKARIDLPKNSLFMPGMSARARFSLNYQGQLPVSLPLSALKRHPDGSFSVFGVRGNTVLRQKVTVIERLTDSVVVQGLSSQMAVIVSGNELLTDGMTVDVVTEKGTN